MPKGRPVWQFEVPKVDRIRKKYGDTKLTKATYARKLKRVKYLVENCGANIDARNIIEYTPLMCACYIGSSDIVRYLFDSGANLHIGNTLLLAVANDSPFHDTGIVRMLLDA